ncbi:hypothetical protein Tco_1070919 [Tanacetum coccineum]|uniref:Uncharacterized protein n=1 Tax=Tanacetum coccineum TaxID=301880 RepID=A0ABQ5HPJ2_9ASTR
MPKEKKLNLKRTARISVRPCCISNPRPLSPPYHPLSSPTDYQSAPPSTPNALPPLSPIISLGISPRKILLTPKTTPPPLTSPPPVSPPYHPLSPPTDYQSAPPSTPNALPLLSPIISLGISQRKILLTPKTTPPPLTSPPPAPTQPSKHSSPLAINLDPTKFLFSTPPTSPQTLFDTLEDLSPTTTNPPPPRPSFNSIKRLANKPLPTTAMEPPLPSILNMEPPLPPLPPQLPTFPPNLHSNFLPLSPL